MKPFLSNKRALASEISLQREDDIITDDLELAKTLNDLFENAVYDLGITEYEPNPDIDI